MIASPPIDTAVETPSPAALKVDEISVVMPPLRDITPTMPGLYAFAASFAGPPMPPIFATPGRMIPRQFGPMMRAPPPPAGRPAPHDLRAVIEAFAREVHRLAAGDSLHDERRALVDQHVAHAATFCTARRAASCIDTDRSQYSTPYFSRILKPSSSQAPGMRKIAIFSAGSKPSSMQALITPRATMSTRVLETIDIITAIRSTPGFCSTSLASPHVLATEGLPPISQ